jgi:DNA-binding GntR family transcriptional regulator
VQKEHWPIVEALGKGAGKNAGKLLRKHIQRFASWPDAAIATPSASS